MGHHVGEHEVDRKQEGDRQHDGQHSDGEFLCLYPEHLEQAVTDGDTDDAEEIYVAGEMEVPARQHGLDDGGADKPQEDVAGYLKPPDIEGEHAGHQGHDHDHHGESPGRHADDRRLGELDGHHEYHHRDHGGEQHQPAHPLAVENEEQREVDQSRAGLFLGQNQQDGDKDDGQRLDIVGAIGVEVEVV